MKSRSFALSLFALTFSIFLFTSCAEKKNDAQPAAQEEKSEVHDHESHSDEKSAASAEYQCPMDCEDGKTYEEAGSCPVCKMDLKAQNKAEVMSCKKGEDGKCSCKKKCKCKNCPNKA